MKKLVLLLILVTVAFAVNTRIQNVLPPVEDNRTSVETHHSSLLATHSSLLTDNMPLIGRQDVVGYTSFDWQTNGPISTICRLDPVANGVHFYWMFSNFAPGTDRNQRYNFYDLATRQYNWTDGVNIYTIRSGFGGFDYDPITGHGVASTHNVPATSLAPNVARDQAPGAGLFEYCPGPAGYQWPAVGVTQNQMIHVAYIEGAMGDSCYYAKINPWCTWSAPMMIHNPAELPAFPDQNIAASKTSQKVVILWQTSDDVYPVQGRAFYRLSTTGGTTWDAQVQMPFPPSTGITPGYNISSLHAMFDNSDNLRIVASVSDTGRTLPAQIWLYSPANPSPWTLVHHYDAETLAAAVGYNAIFATRPSIVQATGTTGKFYVSWEQFDSLNYEPLTSLARADIYVAELSNNGQSVTRKGRITTPNTTSKRFPCVGGVKNDTLILQYLIDSIAGFENYTQGRATRNPIVCQRFHVNSLPIAIEEENPGNNYIFSLSRATPNPFTTNTKISYSLPKTGNIDLTIYDILGRPIKNLVSGTKTVGAYTTIWNGRTNSGELAKSGVYFYTLKTANKSISNKIIKTN